MQTIDIAGYTYGTAQSASSPLTDQDLESLKTTVLFTDEDERYLRLAGEVLDDQIEDVLDLWYGFVGSHPHLVYYFRDRDGNALGDYLAAVRLRFGQWIRDTCAARYDRAWLDYQEEIALRHTSAKKNVTDGANATSTYVPLRYMIAFIVPITATIRSFLAAKGHDESEVDKMHQAWFKSVVLQVTLWSRPYAKDGSF